VKHQQPGTQALGDHHGVMGGRLPRSCLEWYFCLYYGLLPVAVMCSWADHVFIDSRSFRERETFTTM